MKKLFTLIVAICATTLAWADDSGWCGVTYTYVSSTGTLTISGTGTMEDFTSSSKVPWNAYSSSIKKVVIENGVTSIGKYAFYGCTGLTSVTIPNSVTSIGLFAFMGCTGLTSVTIPNSVTSIEGRAFEGCTALTSATIPNSVTSIGSSAFSGCTSLTGKVVIPEGVTSIENSTFSGCTGLTSATIPNSVTSIGLNAFSGCTALTSVTIGNGVTIFNQNSFSGCTALTSITIPNSARIGFNVFYGCTGMTSINVAEDNLNYASIDGVLYSKDKKTLIMYPKGKTGSFTIPNGVTSIGDEDDYASCEFEDCTGLTSVTIPNSVTSIWFGAFRGCTGLTSMTVEATNPPLAGDQYGNGLEMPNYDIPLYVPAGSVNAYKRATEWKKFTNIQAIPATGVNEAAAEKSEVKKIIDRNGIIYIEKDGTRYFLNGGKAE